MRAAIPNKGLRALPFHTLAVIAMAVARDIDAGDDDKRSLLETIFDALKRC